MLHQVAQQAELRRPEVDVLPVALDAVGRQVHGKVGEGQHLAAELRLAPPQHRIDAGNQLGRRARLGDVVVAAAVQRSEEHTSELQSLMRISYAVFSLKKTIMRNSSSAFRLNHKTITSTITYPQTHIKHSTLVRRT